MGLAELFELHLIAQSATTADVRSLGDQLNQAARVQQATLVGIGETLSAQGGDLVGAIRTEAAEHRELFLLGMTALVQRLDHHTDLLIQIRDALTHPAATSAAEKCEQGIHAYRHYRSKGRARSIDDAVKAFDQAVAGNPYDYTPYFFLADIYVRWATDDDKAMWAFSEAAHYAEPQNAEASALALLGLAAVRWANGDFDGAWRDAAEAVERAPELGVAHLHLARYHAISGYCTHAAASSGQAIRSDPALFTAVASDPFLANCREVTERLNWLYSIARDSAQAALTSLQDQLWSARAVATGCGSPAMLQQALQQGAESSVQFEGRLLRADYVDLLQFVVDARLAQTMLRHRFGDALRSLASGLRSTQYMEAKQTFGGEYILALIVGALLGILAAIVGGEAAAHWANGMGYFDSANHQVEMDASRWGWYFFVPVVLICIGIVISRHIRHVQKTRMTADGLAHAEAEAAQWDQA